MNATITIVYDNTTRTPRLIPDWGFACVVRTPRKTLLFDTGANHLILQNNMDRLGIDPRCIDAVFISHAHWDHVGGLGPFLDQFPVEVYAPVSFRKSKPDHRFHHVNDPVRIGDGLFSTGELGGMEQALVIRDGHTCALVAGCSHPGVANLIAAATPYGKVTALIGGLHGFNRPGILSDFSLICPTHCTRHKELIKNQLATVCIEGGVGTRIRFGVPPQDE